MLQRAQAWKSKQEEDDCTSWQLRTNSQEVKETWSLVFEFYPMILKCKGL